MQTIWKWKLKNKPAQTIEVPKGTRIVYTNLDNENDICLWGIVNPAEKTMEELQVAIVGTGWKIEDLDKYNYVGTVKDGLFFWHIFVNSRSKRFGVYYHGIQIGETDTPDWGLEVSEGPSRYELWAREFEKGVMKAKLDHVG